MTLGRKIIIAAKQKVEFLKYFKFLEGAKVKFFVAIAAGFLYGASSGFGIPIILKISSERIFSQNSLPSHILILASLAPVIAMTLRAIFSVINSYYLGFCGQKILQGLRVMIFDKIQRLPLEYFKVTDPGALITRSLSDTAILQETIISASQEIIKQPIAVCGAVSALIYLCCKQSNGWLLLIFFLATAIVIFPIKALGQKVREKAFMSQQATEGIATKLSHNLSAIQEIRAFAMEESEVAHYRVICDTLASSIMKSLKYSVIMSPLIEIIASIGVGFAMFYCYKSHVEMSTFVALTGALYLSYEPIKKIGELSNTLKAGSASLSRIESLLEYPEKICDPENPVAVDRLPGNIEFRDVSFSYGGETNALADVSIRMESGNAYALVGSSGAGKTTMANLILRFYDVTGGAITIDGIDIRSMLLKDLRKNISFVPQSPTLVNGTILENIKWSAPDATFAEVVAAAQKAYAHDFILQLENQYETSVGEGGARLSGGQKQRIAIARAFLRNAPILILDEATSALDSNSEHEVHSSIENLAKDRTSIFISHRFTMMSIVDTVFVLDHGKVAEIGSPDELASQPDSIYYSLYQKQRGFSG
ncbi:MAG: ABC transporter ATP-binding protein/permease [Puniceicoccales bacterium]|jgi:subfamily B ATP-binding cassette protein MsbA|nr:ABC transporter ATP-binding protein/permease [Puniceicoccales bacterium]